MEEKEIIEVMTLPNGRSAIEINSKAKGREFKIAEVTMLGKVIKYEKGLFQPRCTYKAEIISDGKIRII